MLPAYAQDAKEEAGRRMRNSADPMQDMEKGHAMRQNVEAALSQVKNVILGKDDVIEKVFMAVLAQGHVLLDDVPGVGKTTMALAFAKSLGLEYKRVQFTSDTMPSDIIGFSVYNRETASLEYKPGAIMCNLLLADEINRTSSKTQSALLEAMEEGRVTIDGITHELPAPFLVLATENPVGSAGTQMLPNSQLDRFTVRLSMGYPAVEHQVNILKARHAANPLDRVQTTLDTDQLQQMIAEAAQIFIADDVYLYLSQLIEATRHDENVELGVSPRGALALMRMSQAHAYVRGSDYVLPSDVLAVFGDVCGHRLMLNAKARLNEVDAGVVLERISQSVPIPQLSTDNPLDR